MMSAERGFNPEEAMKKNKPPKVEKPIKLPNDEDAAGEDAAIEVTDDMIIEEEAPSTKRGGELLDQKVKEEAAEAATSVRMTPEQLRALRDQTKDEDFKKADRLLAEIDSRYLEMDSSSKWLEDKKEEDEKTVSYDAEVTQPVADLQTINKIRALETGIAQLEAIKKDYTNNRGMKNKPERLEKHLAGINEEIAKKEQLLAETLQAEKEKAEKSSKERRERPPTIGEQRRALQLKLKDKRRELQNIPKKTTLESEFKNEITMDLVHDIRMLEEKIKELDEESTKNLFNEPQEKDDRPLKVESPNEIVHDQGELATALDRLQKIDVAQSDLDVKNLTGQEVDRLVEKAVESIESRRTMEQEMMAVQVEQLENQLPSLKEQLRRAEQNLRTQGVEPDSQIEAKTSWLGGLFSKKVQARNRAIETYKSTRDQLGAVENELVRLKNELGGLTEEQKRALNIASMRRKSQPKETRFGQL